MNTNGSCVGQESQRLGHGGDRMPAQITGLSVDTVAAGCRELQADQPAERIRVPSGGRPRKKGKRLPTPKS